MQFITKIGFWSLFESSEQPSVVLVSVADERTLCLSLSLCVPGHKQKHYEFIEFDRFFNNEKAFRQNCSTSEQYAYSLS